MSHIITEPCIGTKDTACTDVCPVDCIHGCYGAGKSWEQCFIKPDDCIDCGLCVDACPVGAIFPMEEVPGPWHDHIAKNFAQFGLEAP